MTVKSKMWLYIQIHVKLLCQCSVNTVCHLLKSDFLGLVSAV